MAKERQTKSKNLDWDKYWAETIYRKEWGGKDYLFAYVRKRFAEDDVVMDGAGSWIGLIEEPVYRMKTDNDENSDTFGERIPEVNEVHYQDGHTEKLPIQRGTRFRYEFEATPTNEAKFKKLSAQTIQGTTKFIWCLPSGRDIQCRFEDEFWTMSVKKVLDHDLKRKRINKDDSEV